MRRQRRARGENELGLYASNQEIESKLMSKKTPRTVGDILKIDLKNGKYGFARVLPSILCAFYDIQTEVAPNIDYIISRPVLFKIWVMDYSKNADWQVIGNRALEPNLKIIPLFCKQDIISKKLSIHRDDGNDIPATLAECEGLEIAAVWSACHIEDRLRDHFAGQKNKWVESIKIKIS
jgi:hypothetical protein